MAELNNRKRTHSPEKSRLECQEDASHTKITNAIENVPDSNAEVESDTETTTTAYTDDTAFISKSAIKSFSRILPRNVIGTIGRKTSLFTRRNLRSGRASLQNLNQVWDTLSTLSSLENDSNKQGEATKKLNQTLRKNYTLKLRKLKEKFKTKRQLRKERFRSLRSASQNQSRKELNQSKIENNKQAELLEKLLEKHNKHLESL